jgi:hypothetical protein
MLIPINTGDTAPIIPSLARGAENKFPGPKIFQGENGQQTLRNMLEYAKKCKSFPGLNDREIESKIIALVKGGEEVARNIEHGAYGVGNRPSVEDVLIFLGY